MGGPCEAEMAADTPEEMMSKGMHHLEIAHPELAEKIKATPHDDPMMVSWNEKFAKDWASAHENT